MTAFETISRLEAALPTVPPFRKDFALSLVQQSKRKALSEKQMFWVEKILKEATTPAPPAMPSAQIGSLAGIKTLFDRARQHLKFPAIVMGVPAAGVVIRINIAGTQAKFPGSLNVVKNERDEVTGRRDWYGRVKFDGAYEPGPKASEIATAVAARLVEFAANPARIAAEHGRLTGRCCFCNLALTDERSTAVGYGKVCARKWGLPWGEV